MAQLTIGLSVGAISRSRTPTFSDTRAIEFADDLVALWGASGETLTRAQAVDRYLAMLQAQINDFAKHLKQRRLDAAAAAADDLVVG